MTVGKLACVKALFKGQSNRTPGLPYTQIGIIHPVWIPRCNADRASLVAQRAKISIQMSILSLVTTLGDHEVQNRKHAEIE